MFGLVWKLKFASVFEKKLIRTSRERPSVHVNEQRGKKENNYAPIVVTNTNLPCTNAITN